jgi:two-component system, OmpR family, KDP operon response regulator KdpE
MTTILVVDNEIELLDLVAQQLRKNNYTVITATNGAEALKLAFQTQPDLAVLDIMMPGLDGLTMCRRLRELTEIPIIMLTALSEEKMVVQALEEGADDYITKPFGGEEFVARIRASLRRSRMTGLSRSPVIAIDNVIINLARRQVLVAGEVIELTPTEFNLLACLAKRQGEVVSHRTILYEVWGSEYVDQLEYLRIYIGHLRKKIEADPKSPRILMNQRGVGYYLATA